MMFRHAARRALVGALALLFGTSCAGERNVTSPPAADVDVVGVLPGIFLSCASDTAVSVTSSIGPQGGTIAFGRHRLTVPPGALPSVVAITATDVGGGVVRARFHPHGLEFSEPAKLELSVSHCGNADPAQLRIVYVDEALNVLEVLPTVGDEAQGLVSAPLRHFSDYMVSW